MDDESVSSWTMGWDEKGQAVGGVRGELQALRLPHDTTLIARVFGEPSPGSREPRVTFLCASDSGALVTRLEDGSPLWSDPGPGQASYGAEIQSVPEDLGGECRAMFDGWHLIEWFNCTRYEYDRGRLTGTAEYYGPFEAALNVEYGFVTHVNVHVGKPDARRLIELQAWRLVATQPDLLKPVVLDLRGHFV